MRIDSVILIGMEDLDDGGAGGGSSMVGDQLACSVIDPHKAQLNSDCDGADDELCDDSGDSADDACHVSVSPLSRDMEARDREARPAVHLARWLCNKRRDSAATARPHDVVHLASLESCRPGCLEA